VESLNSVALPIIYIYLFTFGVVYRIDGGHLASGLISSNFFPFFSPFSPPLFLFPSLLSYAVNSHDYHTRCVPSSYMCTTSWVSRDTSYPILHAISKFMSIWSFRLFSYDVQQPHTTTSFRQLLSSDYLSWY
jgi:hypothetical protein